MWRFAQQNLQDGSSSVDIRDTCREMSDGATGTHSKERITYFDFSVEPAWTPEGRIDGIRTISRGNDHYPIFSIFTAVNTIHYRQQLRDDPFFDFSARSFFPSGTKSINFIQYNDARTLRSSVREYITYFRLRFAMICRRKLGTVDNDD